MIVEYIDEMVDISCYYYAARMLGLAVSHARQGMSIQEESELFSHGVFVEC